jgi:hypothetical protein
VVVSSTRRANCDVYYNKTSTSTISDRGLFFTKVLSPALGLIAQQWQNTTRRMLNGHTSSYWHYSRVVDWEVLFVMVSRDCLWTIFLTTHHTQLKSLMSNLRNSSLDNRRPALSRYPGTPAPVAFIAAALRIVVCRMGVVHVNR